MKLLMKIIKNLFKIILILIILGIMVFKFFIIWNTDKSIEIWNNIITNIELYNTDNWVYPKSLNDLIPNYYKKIPHSTSWTRKFFYKYNKTDWTYELYFTYWFTKEYRYLSKEKEWYKY